MKNTYKITAGLIIVLLLLVGAYLFTRSYHVVGIALSNNVNSVDIFTEQNTKIASLEKSDYLWLKNGNYYAMPTGEKISKDSIKFIVAGHKTSISLNPMLSNDYLKRTLESELPLVSKALEKKYPNISNDYILTKAYILGDEEDWFGGLLIPQDPEMQNDYYRVVLHKSNEDWSIVNKPELILNYSDYSTVPTRIIKYINSL